MAAAYTRLVDNARKATVIAFAACGAGLVVCAKARYDAGATMFGCGVLACLAAVMGFALEYLLRCWLLRPGRGLAYYQFSLGGMLIATAGVAFLLAIGKTVLGAVVLVLLAFGLVLFACIWESWFGAPQPKADDRPRPILPGAPELDDFVPQVSRQDVLRVIQRDFPGSDGDALLRILDRYGSEPWEREKDRVHLAILKVSSGEESRLPHLVEDARYDLRHILCRAEFPKFWATGLGDFTAMGPEEKARLLEEDRRQYQEWLQRQ